MEAKKVLGIDLGGTHLRLAAACPSGELLDKTRIQIDYSGFEVAIKDIERHIESYWEVSEHAFGSIGVAVKGLVGRENGVWQTCSSIRGFRPNDIAGRLRQRFGVPVCIDNDVRAATVAEARYGAGSRYQDFVYYNIGTGIAVGAILGGHLLHGYQNYSGELGHMLTENGPDTDLISPEDDLETIASGGAIIRQSLALAAQYPASLLGTWAREQEMTSRLVFRAANAGDEVAMALAERVLRSLKISVIMLLNFLNPEAIVFGGGVMSDGWLIARLKDFVAEYLGVRDHFLGIGEVTLSKLGSDDVGLLGAVALTQWQP